MVISPKFSFLNCFMAKNELRPDTNKDETMLRVITVLQTIGH